MRFATIGTSSIVDLFGEAVEQSPATTWTVAYSRDAARAAAYAGVHGARPVSSLDELAAAGDVDAVYVASPNALHHDQAAALLQAGKHVLVEKSACATAAEWDDLCRIADERGLLVVESVRSVFDPSWRTISSYAKSLEPVRQVNLQMCQRSRRYDNFLAGRVENIFRPELAAGALMDLGVYCLHPLVALFGAPRRVQASSVLLHNGIDAATTLLLDFADPSCPQGPGFTATVTCSKVSANPAPSVIAGEDATLVIDRIADPRRLHVLHAHGAEPADIVVDKPKPQQAYVLDAFAAMADDLEAARPFREATATCLRVVDEARRQTGVRFPADRS